MSGSNARSPLPSELEECIANGAAAAIRRYKHISGHEYETEMPEIYMGGFIAGVLHEEFDLNARIEVSYNTIAAGLGASYATSNERADVVLYQNNMPIAAIELKVHKDYSDINLVVADKNKLLGLAKICNIPCYLGIFVTDTEKGSLYKERVAELGKRLRLSLIFEGKAQRAAGWEWCIAVARIS